MTSKLEMRTTYPAIVGQVLANRRSALKVKQAKMAKALNVGQSAWSRVETGQTALNIEQLRTIALELKSTPDDLLAEADRVEKYLRGRGMNVVPHEEGKQSDLATALIVGAALGLLLATVFSRK